MYVLTPRTARRVPRPNYRVVRRGAPSVPDSVGRTPVAVPLAGIFVRLMQLGFVILSGGKAGARDLTTVSNGGAAAKNRRGT